MGSLILYYSASLSNLLPSFTVSRRFFCTKLNDRIEDMVGKEKKSVIYKNTNEGIY